MSCAFLWTLGNETRNHGFSVDAKRNGAEMPHGTAVERKYDLGS
jgi:hypothetical protein